MANSLNSCPWRGTLINTTFYGKERNMKDVKKETKKIEIKVLDSVELTKRGGRNTINPES